MAKEAIFIQTGNTLDLTLTADVSVGDVVVNGALVGVANNTGLTGEVVGISVEGVWEVNATTADAITIGAVLYFDETAREMTIVATGNVRAGLAVTAKGAATAGVVSVKLGA